MAAYRAGEIEGFARLYELLAGDLQRYFRRTPLDAAAAEDLVQETFLELHRARRTHLPGLPVRPWVFGIARHVLARHRRARGRRARLESALPVGELGAPATPSRLETADVRAAVERLAPSRRAPWLLHHVEGLSFQEIAARLRIGVGAAKLRSSRAMKSLRRTLLGRGGQGVGDDD
jgi:RNA polymerase sigma-70 factor, ECF subfamily